IATDNAGNMATAQIPINLDKTPPVLRPTASPTPNSKGWNNSNVAVAFTATDSLSGVANATAPVVISREGAGQILAGTATDLAGNQTTATTTINLDKTPPAVQNSISPQPNAAG